MPTTHGLRCTFPCFVRCTPRTGPPLRSTSTEGRCQERSSRRPPFEYRPGLPRLICIIETKTVNPPENLQMLFRTQRQLDHPFKQLVCGQSDEVVYDEFLGVEPDQVA